MGRPVAAAFGAHVIGIAFLYYPIVPVADGGYTLADIYGSRAGVGSVPPEMIETQQRDNAAAAKAAIDRFATATARARVSAESLSPGANFASAGEQFGRIARHFDLSVVGQAEPESSAIEDKDRRSRLVRFWPAGHRRALHPESAAQA